MKKAVLPSLAAALLFGTLLATEISAAPLDFSALPEGAADAPPSRSAAPFAIPAPRVADGLVRVLPDQIVQRNVPGFRESVFFDGDSWAKAYEAALRENGGPPVERSDTCFATPGSFRSPADHDDRPLAWDTATPGFFTAQTFSGDAPFKVVPVRAERWREANGKVRLETTRFWVDLRSGGTRLISRTESELAPVAAPFAGVSVHALRTARDAVSFFVRRDYPANAREAVLAAVNLFGIGLTTTKQNAPELGALRTIAGEDARSSGCSFQRIDLKVRPASRDLDAAKARARTVLAQSKSFAGILPLEPANLASVSFTVVLEFDPEPERDPGMQLSRSFQRHGTALLRDMVVNLGLAEGAPGEPPVPSVSYRWLERPVSRTF
ncbi:MAG TPA: hypothetical protein VGK73_30900 [Polyangiaceae bacterium]